jgi:hypothetical protein
VIGHTTRRSGFERLTTDREAAGCDRSLDDDTLVPSFRTAAGERRRNCRRRRTGTAMRDARRVVSMREVIRARGHDHVAATHGSSFEVTTDDWLTPAGDCIVGIEADRAPADFDADFVAACRDPEATITLTLALDDRTLGQRVRARGHPELTFESERSAVVRTSTYVDDRTVAVGADASAADLDRDIVAAVADGAELALTLAVG